MLHAGPWDGLAGFIKRTLRQRIIDEDLVLSDEKAVFEEIRKLCAELKCEGKVDHWNVMWLGVDEVERPIQGATDVKKICHTTQSIGVRDLFHFAVGTHDTETKKTGLVLQQFSCGCGKCIGHEFDDLWQIPGCCSNQVCCLDNIHRTDDRGIAGRRVVEHSKALQLAKTLNASDFVAMETGDFRRTQREGGGSVHGFHIARVLPQGDAVAYKVADDRAMRSHGNEAYRAGDTIVLLRLYDRDEADGSGLTFKPSDRTYVANAKSLKHVLKKEAMVPSNTRRGTHSFKLDGSERQRIESIVAH